MVFRLNTKTNNIAYVKAKVKIAAKKLILFHHIGPAEIALDKYFYEKYHKTLKQMCLIVLVNSSFSVYKDEIVISFIDKKIDDIATLITYGNEKLAGSDILVTAFRRR